MEPWEQILAKSLTTPEEVSSFFKINRSDLERVVSSYPMLINPYYLNLIKEKGDPLYRQAVPDLEEITHTGGYVDPLNEENLSPVPGLTHKYPDRVLFLVSGLCAMYCRFCNRKRKVGKPDMISRESIREGISYIKSAKMVRDVLLSGGDPLLLPDNELFQILHDIRAIPHVEIIRIGTRVPCSLPHRITRSLVNILKRFHPLYINTHFNHPSEVTVEAATACNMLADAGIPLGCQTVLLKGVNDDPDLLKELMRKLIFIRVKPYYLFQADLARGTAHFWTPLAKGLEIMKNLQGHITGLCVPRFMIDLPEGGGKIPVIPEYIIGRNGHNLIIRNYMDKEYVYPVIDQ
ncbi:MAG: KamA family radical SAM protein [Deltaproteobacteria bacterium]|nr:KamA family radical SAM protein [Deltaproteobacteria bacterium]